MSDLTIVYLIMAGVLFLGVLTIFYYTHFSKKEPEVKIYNPYEYRLYPYPFGEKDYYIERRLLNGWEKFEYFFLDYGLTKHTSYSIYSLEEGKKMVEQIKKDVQKRMEDSEKRLEEIKKRTVYL